MARPFQFVKEHRNAHNAFDDGDACKPVLNLQFPPPERRRAFNCRLNAACLVCNIYRRRSGEVNSAYHLKIAQDDSLLAFSPIGISAGITHDPELIAVDIGAIAQADTVIVAEGERLLK